MSKKDLRVPQVIEPAPASRLILTPAGDHHVWHLPVFCFDRDDRHTANYSRDTLQSPRKLQCGQIQI